MSGTTTPLSSLTLPMSVPLPQMPTSPGPRLLEIDGRTLEGGGQLLRLAVGLSAFTGIPIRITNIRGNRSAGGGLKAQHLACVNWLAHASNATVSGAEKGSKELSFAPGQIGPVSPAYTLRDDDGNGRGNKLWECKLDIKTAGSTGLALQAILPFILFRPPKGGDGTLSDLPIRLTISGGTNVAASPSYEYITQVLLPTLNEIGLPHISAVLNKRGWSLGGSNIGSFTLEIPPRQSLRLPAFHLYPKTVDASPTFPERIDATLIAPATAHAHLQMTLPLVLGSYFGSGFSEDNGLLSLRCEDSKHDKRYYLLLVANISTTASEAPRPGVFRLGRDWLYDRKVRSPEQTVTELTERVSRDLHAEWSSGAYVDEHMRDQLVVFQALTESGSRTFGGVSQDGKFREPSLHATTAEWIAREMLGVGVK